MDVNELIKRTRITPSRGLFLDRLARASPEGSIVECGVYFGMSASILINAAGPERKIYLCDSFSGFPPADDEPEHVKRIIRLSQAHTATIDRCRWYLMRLGLPTENVVFVKGFFEDSMPAFSSSVRRIALLHFDGDLYGSAAPVFKHLLPLVVKGGFVVIHDYPGFPGVKKAVEEFFDVKKIVVEGEEEVYFKV